MVLTKSFSVLIPRYFMYDNSLGELFDISVIDLGNGVKRKLDIVGFRVNVFLPSPIVGTGFNVNLPIGVMGRDTVLITPGMNFLNGLMDEPEDWAGEVWVTVDIGGVYLIGVVNEGDIEEPEEV